MKKVLIEEKEVAKKSKIIEELKEKYAENINKQVQVYLAFLQKIDPVIKYIKDYGYYFSHPELNEITTRGPILGKNKRTNMLYVFDLKDKWVKEIDMYDTSLKPKMMTLEMYFEKYDFETAMKGLSHLVNFQDKIINELEKLNTKSEKLINEYMKIMDEEPN